MPRRNMYNLTVVDTRRRRLSVLSIPRVDLPNAVADPLYLCDVRVFVVSRVAIHGGINGNRFFRVSGTTTS